MPLNILGRTLLAAVLVLVAGPLAAEDFHVESRVFKVGDTKPIIETTTIFAGGVVYDFLKDPQGSKDPEATIFDPAGRFAVIDPERKLCTEIALDDVRKFSKELRIEAAGHKDPLLNFLSNPQFTEKSDGDQLEFNSAWMIYRLKTTAAKSDEIARQYSEFSYWHGQLNVMINPRSLPPFGRMAVSEQLERRKLLPLEVFMTVSPKGPTPKLVLRAEHRFQWTILERDRQLIDDAQRQFKLFNQVSLQDYNQRRTEELTQAPAKSKTKTK